MTRYTALVPMLLSLGLLGERSEWRTVVTLGSKAAEEGGALALSNLRVTRSTKSVLRKRCDPTIDSCVGPSYTMWYEEYTIPRRPIGAQE